MKSSRQSFSPLGDPFHRGQHTPQGVSALFFLLLGQPQPAWPGDAQVNGFARYAQSVELDGPLRAFLDAYPAPLVFTLGSTAVHRGSDLLHESLAAALQLKQRAVRFTGSKEHAAASAVSIVERLLPG